MTDFPDILFIHPGDRRRIYQKLGESHSAVETPLWCAMLAQACRDLHASAQILDAEADDLTAGLVADAVKEIDPAVVAIVVYGHQPNASTQNMSMAADIAAAIKHAEPNRAVLMVGGHVAALPEKTLRETHTDFVVLGEGFKTVAMAAHAFAGARPAWPREDILRKVEGLMWTGSFDIVRTPVPTLYDGVPRAAYDLLDMSKYRAHNHQVMVADIDDRGGYASIYTTLGCPFSCVAANSLIGLPSGLIYAAEQSESRRVNCAAGHSHSVAAVGDRGEGVATNGAKACVRVIMKNGMRLVATPDHAVLCAINGELAWRQAGELRANDAVAVSVGTCNVQDRVALAPPVVVSRTKRAREPASLPAEMTPDLAWITGLLIADGCIPKDGRPSITFATKPRSKHKLRDRLERCFGARGVIYAHSATDKIDNLWVHSRWIREFFVQTVGVLPSDKLRVPATVRSSPPDVGRAFIDGLMAGDGYWPSDGSHAYLATVSERLAREVTALACWVGIPAAVYDARHRGTGFGTFRVLLCTDDCWMRVGGPGCQTSTVPTTRRVYTSKKTGQVHWRTSHRAGVTRSSRSLVAAVDPAHPLLRRDFVYTHVAAVSDAGVVDVVDATEPESLRFSAGSIAVHNCGFCPIQAPFKPNEASSGLKPDVNSYRFKDPDVVVAEIRDLYKTHGVKTVRFNDELFVLNKKHVDAICDGLATLPFVGELNLWAYARIDSIRQSQLDALRRAGFRWLCYGIESASAAVLDDVDKGFDVARTTEVVRATEAAGIEVLANFIFGLPEDTMASMRETLDLACELNTAWANFYSAMAYPGSALYMDARRAGWRLPEQWSGYSQHSKDCTPLPTRHVSAADVLAFRDQAFHTYFERPEYLDMVQRKFGPRARAHIEQMTQVRLRRYLLESAA